MHEGVLHFMRATWNKFFRETSYTDEKLLCVTAP